MPDTDAPRCKPSTTKKAEDDEAGNEVAANGRLIGGVLECCPKFLALIGVASGVCLFSLVQSNPGQEDQRDGGGDEQRDGVYKERGADGPGDNESADGGSRNTSEEKAAVECARRTTSLLGGRHSKQEGHCGHGEHR